MSSSPKSDTHTALNSGSSVLRSAPDEQSATKAELNRLIEERNDKVIELYYVSRLGDLLNIKDAKQLESDMNAYLGKNDIRKNVRFQPESLPRNGHFNFPALSMVTPGYPRKSLSTGNISRKSTPNNNNNNNNNNLRGEKRSSIAVTTSSSASTPAPIITPVDGSHDTHSDLIQFPKTSDDAPVLKRKNSSRQGSSNQSSIEQGPEVKRLKIRSDTDETRRRMEQFANQHSGSSTGMQPKKPTRPNYYPNLYIPPSKPTPIEHIEDHNNKIVDTLLSQHSQATEFYSEDDINTQEKVYLMMKDQVPSKVAHAIPLAELKFMAQTLPLINLIPRAHKAVTTDTINNALNEARVTVVGSRIEELRRLGLWSLRQPKPFFDPWNNHQTHYTTLLEEAKWMQADFKEGTKYKIGVSMTLAQAVMDYWTYGKCCCIKRKPIVYIEDKVETNVTSENVETSVTNADTATATNADTETVTNADTEATTNDVKGAFDIDMTVDETVPAETADVKEVLEKDDTEETKDANNGTNDTSDVTAIIDLKPSPEVKDMSLETAEEKTNGVIGKDDDVHEEDSAPTNEEEDIEKEKTTIPDETTSNDTVDEDKTQSIERIPSPPTVNPEALVTNESDGPKIDVDSLPVNPETTTEPEVLWNPVHHPFKMYISVDELNSTETNLLKEIPVYTGLDKDNDKSNRRDTPFVPISKSMLTLEDDHFYKLVEKQVVDEEQSLSQLGKRRGMFYGNRRNHYLRPPTVPSLRYLRNRTPTIWLPEDDQELVKNINAYSYNWELISSQMIHRPTRAYLSSIERRTPWQCFERFVQLNERFTFNDMKGPRAHNAQQWLIEAHKFQQRQNRRISPLGVGEESIQRGHKRLRWASMFEVMRKTIKKRENAPKPNKAQPRKPLDTKNMKIPTPAEMSQLKAQRDEALRRDVQLRRNAKNRTQQRQLLAAQQAQAQRARTGNKAPNQANGKEAAAESPTDKVPLNSKTQNSIPPVDKNNPEMMLVLNYTKRILSQNPELPPAVAWKTAENYVKKVKEQQLQLKQQQIQLSNQQGQSSSQPVQSMQSGTQSPRAATITTQQNMNSSPAQQGKLQLPPRDNSNNTTANKIKSPTPSEILQRFQK